MRGRRESHSVLRQSTALILAGGRSRRMGEDKAFLTLGEKTFVEFLVARLQPLFLRVAVVAKDSQKFSGLVVDVIEDTDPDSSSMIGLASGLAGSDTAVNFVVPCDAPFIPAGLIAHMAEFGISHEAVILSRGSSDEINPLPGFFHRDLLEPLQDCIEKRRYELRRFLESRHNHVVAEFEWRSFDPEGRSFINVNTPSDYDLIREQEAALTLI